MISISELEHKIQLPFQLSRPNLPLHLTGRQLDHPRAPGDLLYAVTDSQLIQVVAGVLEVAHAIRQTADPNALIDIFEERPGHFFGLGMAVDLFFG